MVNTYVMLHKESNHEFYADLITGVLKMYEAHDDRVLDTSINRLRIETITHCKNQLLNANKFLQQDEHTRLCA
jgi:hypothetical protein